MNAKPGAVTDVKRPAWMEEYKTCSCTFIGFAKSDLPGYCAKHGTDKRRAPYPVNATEQECGYAHIG